MPLTQRSMRALGGAYGPRATTSGVNQGKVAGAGMADHVHFHVVPRWEGDTNFMPVARRHAGPARGLRDTYRALRDAFDRGATR